MKKLSMTPYKQMTDRRLECDEAERSASWQHAARTSRSSVISWAFVR